MESLTIEEFDKFGVLLAAHLTTILDEPVSYDPVLDVDKNPQGTGYLELKSGGGFHIREPWDKPGRIAARTSIWPKYKDFDQSKTSMTPSSVGRDDWVVTAAINRGAEAVAKHIAKEVPEYKELYAELKTKAEETEKTQTARP